jgi:hypothetical protein
VLELYVLHFFSTPLAISSKVNFTLIRRLLPLARRTPPPPPASETTKTASEDITKLTEYVIHIHSTMTTTAKPPEPSKA